MNISEFNLKDFMQNFNNETKVKLELRVLELMEIKNRCAILGPPRTTCDETPLYTYLMGYGFFCVFFLALIGNCLNLFIYNSDQIRYYVAIRMLCTKLLMNTLMMVFLVPQALRTIRFWELGSESDQFYWKFWPYQAYCINLFGFCAMWLTVLMTAECYIHVFFPCQSKSVCTKRNVSRSYFIIAIVGMLLALIYPVNRTAHIKKDECGFVLVGINVSPSAVMRAFEKIHTAAFLFLAILIPLSLLVFMTASIIWRLVIRPTDVGTANHFSAEKRCVTRITLITTVLQIITEFPAVPLFVYSFFNGPKIWDENVQLCILQTISHFSAICNASLSFFVYISFSNRFRNSICSRAREVLKNCWPKMVSRADTGLKTKTYTSFETSTHHRPHTRSTLVPMAVSASATLLSEHELGTLTMSKSHHGGDTKTTVITNQNVSPTGSINDFFL